MDPHGSGQPRRGAREAGRPRACGSAAQGLGEQCDELLAGGQGRGVGESAEAFAVLGVAAGAFTVVGAAVIEGTVEGVSVDGGGIDDPVGAVIGEPQVHLDACSMPWGTAGDAMGAGVWSGMQCSPFCVSSGAPVSAGGWGTGGVAGSSGDRWISRRRIFGPRAGASLVGPTMPPAPHGRSGSRPLGRRERRTGEPAGRSLTLTGRRRSYLSPR